MAKLTNCEISYERNKKLADYESQKFAAKFSILLDDGEDEDAVTELYGRQIVRFVHEKLGINSDIGITEKPNKAIASPAPTPSAPAIASSTAPVAPPLAVDEAPVIEKKKPGRKPNAEKAAPDAAAQITEKVLVAEGELASAPVITDKQLSEAITACVTVTGDPMACRRIVQDFFAAEEGKVWSSKEIPQARRQEYINRLAELKAAHKAAADVSSI